MSIFSKTTGRQTMPAFSTRDIVSDTFSPAHPVQNEAVAVRSFQDFLEKQREAARKDYSLWYMGEFDFSTGRIKYAPKEIQT